MTMRALLLDRDGVINIDHGYVGTPDRFAFKDGIFALTRRAIDTGWRVVVITNQSGIARGYYSQADFAAVTRHMLAGFTAQGIAIAGVFHCPYLPGGGNPAFARDSFWRKPNPGMILEAARRLDLDLPRSVFLGDSPSDMVAARAAGVATRLLLSETPSPAKTADATASIARLGDAAPYLIPVGQP